MEWTKEQKQCIDLKGNNILVAAAAGSGKTAVLVERIINKIMDEENPIDIDKLLVVTFTNAAASEMRERVLNAIYKKLDENPDNKNLQKQIVILNKASITTIHSFCLDVIRNNFYQIDINPNFRIADESEIKLLKIEVIEELFEQKYFEEDEGFISLINTYTNYRSDEGLKELVLSIFNFIQSNPFPYEWLEEKINMFDLDVNKDFSDTIWGEILINSIKMELRDCMTTYRDLQKQIISDGELNKALNIINIDIDRIEELTSNVNLSWEKGYEYIKDFKFDRLTLDKTGSEELKENIKITRDEIKKRIKKIQENILVYSSYKASEDILYLKKILSRIKELVIKYSEIFTEKKKDRNIIDFNDIEHYALKILISKENYVYTPTEIAMKYKEKYEEILIDEYQDSNMVQEYILSTISKQNNIFMVGDVKQSIYKFRQARPELFLDKYYNYNDVTNSIENSILTEPHKIKLFKNFRSRREVLDIVNFIFGKIMNKDYGELDYNEDEYLNLGAEFKDIVSNLYKPELHMIDTQDSILSDESDEYLDEKVDNIQIEARCVANRIKELFDTNYKVFNKNNNQYRDVTYKDIVILLRSTANYSDIFMTELINHGFPIFSDSSDKYLDSVEIQTIISLLKIIDNPVQDISLIAVLRSVIFGFTDEEIIEIRVVDKYCSFYKAMQKKMSQKDGELSKKIEDFFSKLKNWQFKTEYMTLNQFIWMIYMETGYYSYVSVMQDGIRRQANLKMLFERAKQYESTSFKGLFNFIRFIDNLSNNKGDMSSAKLIGENENVIKIMSIHKSKGLEFPIVFLCGTGKKFNMQDLSKNILLHQDVGIGPEYINCDRRIAYPSLAKLAIREKSKQETIAEEMRILYVALTRAKEKLIITGLTRDMEKQKPIFKANSFLDWFQSVISDQNNIDVFCYNKKELFIDEKEEFIVKNNIIEKINCEVNQILDKEEILLDINNRLNWKYNFENSTITPAKLSVTQLKQKYIEETFTDIKEVDIKKPKFIEEKGKLSATQIGTITHYIIQNLDIRIDYTVDSIKEKVRDMLNKNMITKQEAEGINIYKIYEFTKSNLMLRMRKSSNVLKEAAFYINIPKEDIYQGDKSDDMVLVQGIIDCYFEEDEELILVDYKTDYVNNGDLDGLLNKYRIQLNFYKKALELSTNKKVKEVYIYSLWENKEILC